MDREMTNADTEILGKWLKGKFLKQWDFKREHQEDDYANQYRNLQQPIKTKNGL